MPRTAKKLAQYLDEITDLPAPYRDAAKTLDDLDRRLFGEAILCLRTDPEIDALIRELRRAHRYRPTPQEVEVMAKRIAGAENPELPPGEAAARRRLFRADRMIAGSGEGPGRDRARQVVAALRAHRRPSIGETERSA